MEPDLFPEKRLDTHEVAVAGNDLAMLCFALRMNKNALLPCALYDMPETVEAVAGACREHCLEIGKPLANTTMAVAMKGYYCYNEESKRITCALDKKRRKARLTSTTRPT